jgi:hypothetical protein
MPEAFLANIEQASLDDPVQLQQGFNAYDECSSISKAWPFKIFRIKTFVKQIC